MLMQKGNMTESRADVPYGVLDLFVLKTLDVMGPLHGFGLARRIEQTSFGREPTALMTFLTPATRFTPDEARVYTRRLLDRFRALPGVEAVGATLTPAASSSTLTVDF